MFDVGGILLIHVMTMSELSLHSKIVNSFGKYYPYILLGHFIITKKSMFLKKPQQDIKFIKESEILISNIQSKHLSPCLEYAPEPSGISICF